MKMLREWGMGRRAQGSGQGTPTFAANFTESSLRKAKLRLAKQGKNIK